MAPYDCPILLTAEFPSHSAGRENPGRAQKLTKLRQRGVPGRPVHLSPAAECWGGQRHTENFEDFSECRSGNVGEETTQNRENIIQK